MASANAMIVLMLAALAVPPWWPLPTPMPTPKAITIRIQAFCPTQCQWVDYTHATNHTPHAQLATGLCLRYLPKAGNPGIATDYWIEACPQTTR